MCGIVGYLRTPKPIGSFDLNELEDFLTELVAKDSSNISQAEQLSLNGFAGKLIGVEGIVALVRNGEKSQTINILSEQLKSRIEQFEIDNDLEESQKENVGILYDALWRISKDACASAQQIADLLSEQTHTLDKLTANVIAIYRSINIVLRSIDRIEVRGRDSAGISIALNSIEVDEVTKKQIAKRNSSNFTNNTVKYIKDDQGIEQLYFVYKRSAEIGELGDNIKHIRDSIRKDDLLYDEANHRR